MKKEKHVFTDAAAAAAHLGGDPAAADRVRELCAQSRAVFALTVARCRFGYGLDDFARRMGITRRELERIEEGTDADLSPRIIANYLVALVCPEVASPAVEPAQPSPAKSHRAQAKPRRKAATGRAVPKRTAREKAAAPV